MRKICAKELMTGLLLIGAVLFASGAVLAMDHGSHAEHDSAGAETPAVHADEAHGEAAHGEQATHGAEGHGGEHGSIPHLQNLVSGWIAPYVPEAAARNLSDFIDPIYSLTVVLLLALFFVSLRGKLDARRPGRLQIAVEVLFGGLYSMFQAIIGPSARRYTPYLGTLFIFILFNNLAGILPLGHSSTSVFNTTTFALGLLTFLYVQGIALANNGVVGYFYHLAGSPKSGIEWGLSPLFFMLHTIGELIKPVSLSLRLFGNITGEDALIATMVILGYAFFKVILFFVPEAAWSYLPGLPLQLPFYFLALLSSTIQALVFTLLSTVYIALWLPHDDHGAHAHGQQEAHGH